MRIVDARTHVGNSKNTSSKISNENIIDWMDRFEIDAAIVQPLPSASDVKDYRQEHDHVVALAKKFPKRIFGLTCIPPQVGRETYKEAARYYIEEHGFVGLKYHPLFHGGAILSTNSAMVYEIGEEMGTTVSVHTGMGLPWSGPAQLIPAAKKHPDVTFIAVHSGGWIGSTDAGIAGAECPNIMLDTSWQYPITIQKMMETVGPGRLMLASDFPDNLGMQRTLWDSLPISDEEKASGLGELAIKTFGLEGRL